MSSNLYVNQFRLFVILLVTGEKLAFTSYLRKKTYYIMQTLIFYGEKFKFALLSP